MKNLSKTSEKIKLNPHVEAHGKYSVEWSYHFPIQAGLRIESEFEVSFPNEKVHGAARAALAQANLAWTRLSFADSATDVRNQALRFFCDSRWLAENLLSDSSFASNRSYIFPELSPKRLPLSSIRATKFFLYRAKQYWSASFFSRSGIFLQSDLKQNSQGLYEFLRNSDVQKCIEWDEYFAQKRNLLASFRAAQRLIMARIHWDEILKVNGLVAILSETMRDNGFKSEQLIKKLRDLSELSVFLVSRTVADLQGYIVNTLAYFEENLRTLHANIKHDSDEKKEIEKHIKRLEMEKRWLGEWARICGEWHFLCGLPTFNDVTTDAQVAARYFEKMRELKRLHYQVWDLEFKMRPNEQRFDLLLGSASAGVSALFAFVATTILISYNQDASVQAQGLVAFSIFAMANVIVYILKDRLKVSLREKFKKFFHIRSGRWVGNCVLKSPDLQNKDVEPIEIADIERESWWTDISNDANFHVWEEFRITPSAINSNARILKQVWRLPLDEILHSLDASSHLLKIPTIDGNPRELQVHKRFAFPYQLKVRVKAWRNRELVTIDENVVKGRIITSGDCIYEVEDLLTCENVNNT